MPSSSPQDARTLVQAAAPTAAVGAIAAAVAAVTAGGKGALGAALAAVVVIAFMGIGLYVLQRTARSYPSLFQMMGLMLYAVQLLLLFVFVAAFRDTELFNPKAFALTLVAATLAWIGAQTRAHMQAKILYVDPESAEKRQSAKAGSPS